MIDQPDFLPVIALWRRELADRVLCRPLVPAASGEEPAGLLVGFGTRGADARDVSFLTVEDAVRRRLSVEGAEHIARKHLVQRADRPGWVTVRSLAGVWLERKGDEHVAADILDAELMQDAHRLLACDRLVAVVPARQAMLVAPRPLASLLAAAAKAIHDEAERTGRSPLTPTVYLLHDGEIAGTLQARPAVARDAVASAPPPPAGEELPRPEPRDGSAVFSLNCTSVEEIEALARRCIDRHLPSLVKLDWFKGLVLISVNGYMLPATDANKVALQELNEKLDETTGWKALTTRGGKNISVRIRLDA